MNRDSEYKMKVLEAYERLQRNEERKRERQEFLERVKREERALKIRWRVKG